LPSGATTPRFESDSRNIGHGSNGSISQFEKKRSPVKKVAAIDYDSDIDPDDLLPVYLECKTKLFHLQPPPPKAPNSRPSGRNQNPKSRAPAPPTDPETAKILGKIKRIEDDILFDQYVADQQWESKRIQLERDAAAHRSAPQSNQDADSQGSETLVDSADNVSKEAAKIGAALLEDTGGDDEVALANLFASLPVNEVDPLTGKSSTVVNGTNGVKVTIRDFGKWTGVNPTRVLGEACRARYVLSCALCLNRCQTNLF
jgi:ATP-dependent RNA helicase DHX29